MLSATLERRTSLHRGCNLSWFAAGEGEPVIMVQGVGVGGYAWQPQLEALRPHFECVCFDNRGFGSSTPAGEDLTVELMADDVLHLMDVQGWASAHVVGHSLGGLVALHVARTARHRVRSLSLLCTFASGRVPTRITPGIAITGIRTRMGTRAMRRRAFLELVLAPAERREADVLALAKHISELFGHDIADQPPIAMKQFRAMARADATPWLAQLAGIPALVVSAQHDIIAPPTAGRALAAGIPGARYVEIEGSAHGVPIQKATLINELLLDHLRRSE